MIFTFAEEVIEEVISLEVFEANLIFYFYNRN